MILLIKKRNFIKALTLVVLAILCPGISYSQVTVIVNKIPKNTPDNTALYIAGNFNDWNPKSEHYKLSEKENGIYFITLPSELTYLEYKITRGSWESVEGDLAGKKLTNRTFTTTGKLDTAFIQILSWEDITPKYTWNVLVKDVPENTPEDAKIYVSGNFNSWNANDPDYKLVSLENGNYAVTIPKLGDTLIYKFNRGSWSSVECRENGRTLYNRVSVWDKAKTATTIVAEIDAWEDLFLGIPLLYAFILTAAAFQCILLILAIQGKSNPNIKIVQPLSYLMFLTLILLLARLATYNRAVFDWEPKLLLLSDIMYFLYAPLFYLFINRLLGQSINFKYFIAYLFIPVTIQALFYLPLISTSETDFKFQVIDRETTLLFNSTAAIALVYNLIFGIRCLNKLLPIFKSGKKKSLNSDILKYCIFIISHAGACLFLFLSSAILLGLDILLEYNFRYIQELNVDLIWFLFSFSGYIHSYFALKAPGLFENENKQKLSEQQFEDQLLLKAQLSRIMEKEKPYLNPRLTLQCLSDLINVNIHTLSKLINEGYNKNFFDFVNEYRINEFIKNVNKDEFKNFKFLAIAFEVGFSSKATFNRAFKKCMGKTPSEYFNIVTEEQS